MRVGYALICEEHPPNALISHARAAEHAGFAYLSISDHFHPWSSAQGHSPFAWTVIGGLMQATSLPIITQVTCPIKRYHPTIVAQAAATAAAMGPGRLTLGLGTGEALNEHVVGGSWPAPEQRLAMLDEAIEMIRALWSGDEVTRVGRYFVVDRARLFTLPHNGAPPVAVAAGGADAAALAARHGDLVSTSPDPGLVDSYRDGGGSGSVFGQATCCYASDRRAAEAIMAERWRHSAFGWDVNAELPTPAAFEDATASLPLDAIVGSSVLGPDRDGLERSLGAYEKAGFDAVALHNVGPSQRDFIEAVATWGLLQ